MKRIQLGFLAGLLLVAQGVAAHALHVKLHYVGPTEGSTWLGLQQGIAEANIQGEFLGQAYKLVPISLEEAATGHIDTALFMSASPEDVLSIAQLEHLAEVPILNVQSAADSLRTACQPNLFSTPPSDKMLADAQAQWVAKNPNTPAQVQSWHHTFRKFAANQLNGRYQEAQGAVMDDDSWAAWAAMKMISDTVARTNNSEASVVLPYLRNDLKFDGQKGVGSTFRDTGQLRQIVLLVAENEILAEAPLRGSKGGLDSLGLVSCP